MVVLVFPLTLMDSYFFLPFFSFTCTGDHGSAKDATQGTMAKGEWIG